MMRDSRTAPSSPPRRSLWIPGLFIGGMAVVIAVNAFLAYVAISTFSGLDTDQAYAQGLRYNETLTAGAKSAALGWQASPRLDQGELTVALRDRDGRPIADAHLVAYLTRPATMIFDRAIALEPIAGQPGLYGAGLDLALEGAWDLRLIGKRGTDDWQWSERLIVKP